MENKRIIGWDSVTLIDAIEPSSFYAEIEPVYRDALIGKVIILISEISVAEACKIRSTGGSQRSPEETAELIRDFLDNDYIRVRDVTRQESELAADLIRQHSLETCDALIAATAAIHRASILYTRDGVKKRRASQPSLLKCDGKIGDPPLPIKAPCAADYLDAGLFRTING